MTNQETSLLLTSLQTQHLLSIVWLLVRNTVSINIIYSCFIFAVYLRNSFYRLILKNSSTVLCNNQRNYSFFIIIHDQTWCRTPVLPHGDLDQPAGVVLVAAILAPDDDTVDTHDDDDDNTWSSPEPSSHNPGLNTLLSEASLRYLVIMILDTDHWSLSPGHHRCVHWSTLTLLQSLSSSSRSVSAPTLTLQTTYKW